MQRKHGRLLFGLFLLLAWRSADANDAPDGQLTADQIMKKVSEQNRARALNLKGYSSKRFYQVQYHGFFGSKAAEMTVEVRFDAPSSKKIQIISENGSKLLLNHVLHSLVKSEEESMNSQNQQETALTSDNYNFTLSNDDDPDQRYFVLFVAPKRKNKFLFKGRIWIDANDFALARIEAEPANNPSFWISKTNIKHRYAKVEEFWLPSQNISQTNVRLGGTATLTINYRDYVISPQPH
jgi:outer membrane lipoprotein-sorting protein